MKYSVNTFIARAAWVKKNPKFSAPVRVNLSSGANKTNNYCRYIFIINLTAYTKCYNISFNLTS